MDILVPIFWAEKEIKNKKDQECFMLCEKKTKLLSKYKTQKKTTDFFFRSHLYKLWIPISQQDTFMYYLHLFLFCHLCHVLKMFTFSDFDMNQWILNWKEGKLYLRVYKMLACYEKSAIQLKQLWLMSQGLQGTTCSHVCLFLIHEGKYVIPRMPRFTWVLKTCDVGITRQM